MVFLIINHIPYGLFDYYTFFIWPFWLLITIFHMVFLIISNIQYVTQVWLKLQTVLLIINPIADCPFYHLTYSIFSLFNNPYCLLNYEPYCRVSSWLCNLFHMALFIIKTYILCCIPLEYLRNKNRLPSENPLQRILWIILPTRW